MRILITNRTGGDGKPRIDNPTMGATITMKLTSLFLSLLLLAPRVASASSPESVPNGDFEKQDRGSLAGWEPGRAIHRLVPNTDAGTENLNLRFVWDTVSHGKGKGSLRIDGKGLQQGGKWDTAGGIIAAPVNRMLVQPDTEYKLAWFFRARGLSAQTKMTTTVFVQSPGPLGPPPRGSRFLSWKNHEQTKDAEDWQPGSLTFTTPKDAGWGRSAWRFRVPSRRRNSRCGGMTSR